MPEPVIIMDANVIFDIGRGNKEAADALTRYLQTGTTVYIAQAAYDEVVTRNAKTGAGYELLLKDLKISTAPPGSISERIEFQARNMEVPPGNPKQPGGPIKDYARSSTNPDGSKTPNTNLPGDSFVASQAYANKARLWTLDGKVRDRARALGDQIDPASNI